MNYEHRNRKFEPKEASFRAKASMFKALSRNRNIPWRLSLKKAAQIIKQNCYYCGIEPNMVFNSMRSRKSAEKINSKMSKEHIESGSIKYNGIDRLDSKLGYTILNVVPCCKTCNFAKNELTINEFYNWIQRIYKNFKI